MDQNYQPYSFFQEQPPVKDSAYYRAEARDALRGKWPISSIVYFLYTVIQSFASSIAAVPFYIVSFMIAAQASTTDAVPAMLGTMLFSVGFMLVILVFLAAPMTVGLYRIYLDLIDGKDVRFETLFAYFKKGYLHTVGAYTLYTLITVAAMIPMFLGTVFSIAIVGMFEAAPAAVLLSGAVIFLTAAISLVLLFALSCRYSITFFILSEYPEMGAIDALRNSATLMKGNKWKLFCLLFSFIGWILLLIPVSLVTCGIGTIIGSCVLYAYIFTAQAAFYHDVARRDASNDVEFPSLNPDDYNPDNGPDQQL